MRSEKQRQRPATCQLFVNIRGCAILKAFRYRGPGLQMLLQCREGAATDHVAQTGDQGDTRDSLDDIFCVVQ